VKYALLTSQKETHCGLARPRTFHGLSGELSKNVALGQGNSFHMLSLEADATSRFQQCYQYEEQTQLPLQLRHP